MTGKVQNLGVPFVVIPFRPKAGLLEDKLHVNYSDMKKTLKDGLHSLVGYPLCVQEKIQTNQVNSDQLSDILKIYILLQKYVKLKICRKCKKTKVCQGFFKTYQSPIDYDDIIPFS